MLLANVGAEFRLICAVLFGALVAVAGIPGELQAHSFEIEHQASDYGHSDGASHDPVDDRQIDECHPGLDCLTVGAFLLAPSPPRPHDFVGSVVRISNLVSKGRATSPAKPPPRRSGVPQGRIKQT
jgi:hypothetical protein